MTHFGTIGLANTDVPVDKKMNGPLSVYAVVYCKCPCWVPVIRPFKQIVACLDVKWLVGDLNPLPQRREPRKNTVCTFAQRRLAPPKLRVQDLLVKAVMQITLVHRCKV